MQSKKLLVGLTGGIGSGKSLASRYFRELGYPVISADLIAKRLYKTDKKLKRKLVKEFGRDILDEKGNIGGASARRIILSDKKNIKRVNSLVHPFVIREIRRQVKKLKSKIIIKETAIMFESGYADTVDYVVLIYANKALRLARAAKRDRLPKAHISRLMSLQMSEKEKLKLADFVIKNNGSTSGLKKGIYSLNKLLKKLVCLKT
jgi:dephospho-CoA kinase